MSGIEAACPCEGSGSIPHPQRRQPLNWLGSAFSLALGVLATLAPKCPLCLAAYLSVVGVGAAAAGTLQPLLFPAGAALVTLALGSAAYQLGRSRFRTHTSASLEAVRNVSRGLLRSRPR